MKDSETTQKRSIETSRLCPEIVVYKPEGVKHSKFFQHFMRLQIEDSVYFVCLDDITCAYQDQLNARSQTSMVTQNPYISLIGLKHPGVLEEKDGNLEIGFDIDDIMFLGQMAAEYNYRVRNTSLQWHERAEAWVVRGNPTFNPGAPCLNYFD